MDEGNEDDGRVPPLSFDPTLTCDSTEGWAGPNRTPPAQVMILCKHSSCLLG